MKVSNNQKGFGLLEGIVALFIVLALISAGWYVIRSKNKTTQSQQTTSAVTDNAATNATECNNLGENPSGNESTEDKICSTVFKFYKDWSYCITTKDSCAPVDERISSSGVLTENFKRAVDYERDPVYLTTDNLFSPKSVQDVVVNGETATVQFIAEYTGNELTPATHKERKYSITLQYESEVWKIDKIENA